MERSCRWSVIEGGAQYQVERSSTRNTFIALKKKQLKAVTKSMAIATKCLKLPSIGSRGSAEKRAKKSFCENFKHFLLSYRLLQYGNGNRTQHPTDANKESSRSHAVFQVYIKQTGKGSGLSADVKVAKLSMIDLAGSERGSATSSRGAARFREGANINKSLLALGNCINALADGM